MFQRYKPPPHLSPMVEAFWHLHAPGDRTYSGLPKPWVELIFSLSGSHVWWADPSGTRYEYDHSWVTPLQSGVRFASTTGKLDLFGIRLDIFTAHHLFGNHLNTPGYIPIHAKTCFGIEAEDVRHQLITLTSDADRVDFLSHWLAAKMGEPDMKIPSIAELETEGWRVSTLAEAMGIGPRALQNMFLKATGRPPKFWLRLARFDRAVQIAGQQPVGISLADLAAKTGYSDQAHMNREFAEFGGLTPAAYVTTRDGKAVAPPHFVAVPA